jgi:hypothetical protein
MAIQQDDTIVGQPAIDFEALGVKPVSDEDLFGLSSAQEKEQPAKKTEIDFEALGVKPVSDLDLYGFETQPVVEEPRDNSWDTLRGLEVSMRQVPQLAYGVAGLVGETAEQLTGYGESLRDFGFKGYQDWAESMEPISKETDDVTVAWQRAKEGDVGALVDWAQYGIGYALGQLGETAAVAVLGGIAGGAAGAAGGPTAAPAAAGGAVIAAAGKTGFKALAKNLVEKAIANQATKIVANQAKKEGIELTAEQVAKRASQEAVKRQAGKEIGSNAAIFANAVGMQLGSIYGSAEEQARAEGRELTGVDLARIWGTGVATGGIEGVVDKFGLDLLKGKLSDKLPAGRLAGAAVAGGVGTVGEAATEAVQTVGERFGAGKDILSDEAINEYINASALGGLGGGAIGGVGGFISGNPKENAAAKAKVSSEANKDIAPASAETVARQADAIIAETVQETPEQRVARLQEEATAAAGIELEEEGVGVEPPIAVTPPVAPTPEGAVAPVEPVVEPVVAEPPVIETRAENPVVETEQRSQEQTNTVKVFRGVAEAGNIPDGGAFFTDSEKDASAYAHLAALRKAVDENEQLSEIVGEIMSEEGAESITDLSISTVKNIIEGNKIEVGNISEGTVLRGNINLGNALNLESFGSEVGNLPETWNELNELGLVEETWDSLDEDVQAELQDKYRNKAFYSLLEGEVNLTNQFNKGIDTIVFTDQNTEGKGTHRTFLTKAAEQFTQEAAPAVTPPAEVEAEVTPTPEVRESRREPSVEARQQYAPKTEEEQASFDKASSNKVLARSPQLAVAAVRMKNGEITAGEYADLVDAIDPFTAKGADPIPTNDKIYQYMSKTMGASPNTEEGRAKLQKIGAAIPSGKVVEFRIDIPTYNESTKAGDTVYSVTAHEPVSETAKQVGKTISHLGIAKVTNPTFMNRAISGKGTAVAIAAGAGKFPLATVKGNYEPITDLPADINDPNVWTEVGYNPIRSSFFVDVRSKDAVVGGSEAIMVGSRVFVKDAVMEPRPTGVTMGERYAKIQMPRPAGMETEAVTTKLESLGFGRGGIVSVVNEPDASFEGRTIIRDGKVVGIELNAAALKDDAAVERVLNHEIAESANADGALNNLVAGLTPKERKEINDAITRLGYAERARTAEEAARAVELLAEGWRGRRWFERAVARVEAWANKLGYKLTRRAAEYIAARNMAEVNDAFRKRTISDALANLKGAKRVDFNGLSAVLIPPSEMEFAYSIAAYHGTPHEIKGKFLTSKIGTGEGATAYGWGLYFAENIEVAEEYRKSLTGRIKDPIRINGQTINRGNLVNYDDQIDKDAYTGLIKIFLNNKDAAFVGKEQAAQYLESLNMQREADAIRASDIDFSGGVGNIYTVNIDAEPNELLDWDNPVNEEIARKIFDLTNGNISPIPFRTGVDGQPIFVSGRRLTGRQVYEILGASLDTRTPIQIAIQGDEVQKKIASEALLSVGIKGIRYLDQGSRGIAQGKILGIWRGEPMQMANKPTGKWFARIQSAAQQEDGAPESWTTSKPFDSEAEARAWAESSIRSEGTSNYVIFDENAIKITARNGEQVDIRESRREDAIPTFSEGSPEAATLSNMAASMAKVDAASEAKGPTTYKISEIASVWMDQGGDVRQLQDMVVEYTNLTPANAKKVANAIAKQYDIQQSIATAFLETQTGLSVEALPEGVTLPKEVDPDRPRPVMQRLFDVFMGVRVKPVKITGDEKALLKSQIRLKAAANRAAKQEQQRTADEVVEIIKSMELRGPVRPKQAQALAKRAAKVIWTSEKSMESFVEYAAKVVENANYDADLREAKAAQKRAKELSKQKKVAMSPQRLILQQIGNVAANKLDDPRMFAEMINYYLRGFKDVRSPDYVVVPDEEITGYISQLETESVKDQAEVERETNERLARKYDLDPNTIPELMSLINIIEEIEGRENREALESILTDKAIETQDGLRGYDTTALTNTQKNLVESMLNVDLKSINTQERQMFIRISNNMIYNNQTNGAEYFVATAKGQQNARKAAQDSKMIQRNKAWIPLIPSFGSLKLQETLRNFSLELQSVADTFRNVFGKDFMAKAYEMMGMLDLNEGFTKANNTIDEIQDLMAEFHQGNEKTYGDAARNQDGILSEGVAGFLIQEFPFKDEATSIQQRRNLINEYIANARESRQKDRVAMADRVEAILNKVDGASVQEILNNMKREYRPNYDSLMWYKDVLFPKYKDFLKQFDENFNDQANNYDSPNYLPIAFTSAGPALALGPEDVSIANSISLQPKQSVYTIKRQDYTKLPKDKDGNPKEIEFNLRRAAFNSLSDQINKAYTNPAWQQIFAFMKTPESVEFFGDKANRDFFVDRLNRLRASRARRGSVSGGALEKALDSFSIISRKLGTGIALGGVFQWIKQPPDQLLTALGSGGRADLLAKNIAPSTQKAARELLNQFSIGRRGDSSAGYKYINQMEGHQSRMERYFSESKWEQAKEQGGKIADVWMVALKKSDFISASAAWMTYYEGELNKNDIKIDDWAKEAELVKTDPVRRQAAAYAEQMTDIYQGSSDPTSMATFAQSGKTGWENFTKALLVPFNSFAIQQRMRLYSDARDALNGTSGGKGGLAGTIGGLILFHTTKRFVLPVISGGTAAILYGMLGVDMEEPDEEKQKEMADRNWRQFLADITGNLLVGGTPQLVENRTIEAFNYASYMVGLQLESETVMDENGEIMSFDKYSKERSPFYRYKSYDNAMSLGMFDIGFDQAKETALQTKMLMDRDEMEMYTPEEQRLLYFSALSEWLYLMRLNDTDFARIVKKARRDMIKAAEEREKELARIRAGR